MPIDVRDVSISQFCELLGLEPERFIGVQVDRRAQRIGILLEPEDTMAQTRGSIQPVYQGGKKSGGTKKGC